MKYSHKRAQCNKIAETVSKAIWEMGFNSFIEKSNVSASHYVYVDYRGDDGDATLKIRVSDHDDKYFSSDVWIYVSNIENDTKAQLIEGIEKIADFLGVNVPEYYTKESFDARSKIAQKSTIARRINSQEKENEMRVVIVNALRGERLCSPVAAGKVIDKIYSDIPRAQRQRLAYDASAVIKGERGI